MDTNDILRYAEQLKSPYKEVLRLYYQEKLTQKQIAEKMSITLYKVRGHLSKARYLLRKESGNSEYLKARKILYNY